jgi:hypothetical protein
MRAAKRPCTASPNFAERAVTFLRSLLIAFASLAVALPATAVIIDFEDGAGNTTPPPDDPGWANVGIRFGLSVVYLRNGWILTANHVGLGDVWLGGSLYTAVPGSDTQLDNGDGTFADLRVFAITPIPSLPELEIRSNPTLPTGEVILIGHGRNRGGMGDTDDPGIWTPPPTNPSPAIEGWYWGPGATIRWGTNIVEGIWTIGNPDTESIYTVFDPLASTNRTPYECQTANGDSGGALFAKDGADWELAGILWASGVYVGQDPFTSALLGNASIAADLSFYRDDIMTLTATPVPEPSVVLQLGTGAMLLAGMAHRRARRT